MSSHGEIKKHKQIKPSKSSTFLHGSHRLNRNDFRRSTSNPFNNNLICLAVPEIDVPMNKNTLNLFEIAFIESSDGSFEICIK